MPELTDFLLARIAEDEASARAAGGGEWASLNRSWDAEAVRDIADVDGVHERLFPVPMDYDEHVARHNPARVLAECETKRRIVRMNWTALANIAEPGAGEIIEGARRAFNWVERVLALPYADHDQFQEEWRP